MGKQARQQAIYLITVLRCEESGVFVGRSTDIPGLHIEASTPIGIVEAIAEVAPQLMKSNLKLSLKEIGECQINVQIQPTPTKKRRLSSRPHIFLDSELVGAAA